MRERMRKRYTQTETNLETDSDDEIKRNKCCLFQSQAQLTVALPGMADALAC